MAEENLPISEEEMNTVGTYPMFFGVSCAFLALHFLSAMDGSELGHQKSCFAEIMLRGSAQLLGVLFEKAQKNSRGSAGEGEDGFVGSHGAEADSRG